MDQKVQRRLITAYDKQRTMLKDKKESFARGMVEIYANEEALEKKEPVYTNDNLIVYASREIIAQKLFNMDRVDGSGEKDLQIRWISFGSGGAPAGSLFSPYEVSAEATGLQQEIILDDTNVLYADSGKKKPIGSTEIIQDSLNANKFIIIKTTTIVEKVEGNGNNFNEMALWWSDSDDPNTASVFTPACIFNFPTLPKTSFLEPIIVWYWFV